MVVAAAVARLPCSSWAREKKELRGMERMKRRKMRRGRKKEALEGDSVVASIQICGGVLEVAVAVEGLECWTERREENRREERKGNQECGKKEETRRQRCLWC